MFLKRILAGCAALPLALALTAAPPAAPQPADPPTKAEILALLENIEKAAAAKDPAPILALLADDAEIKTTLRLGETDRHFIHTKAELTTELPTLLTPAAKPRTHCHLLSLSPAADAPAALFKYQWALTLQRPDGELRVEGTGGALVLRSEGRLILSRINQLIARPGSSTGGKATNPRNSPNDTKTWRYSVPKKKQSPAPPEPQPQTPAPTPAPAR